MVNHLLIDPAEWPLILFLYTFYPTFKYMFVSDCWGIHSGKKFPSKGHLCLFYLTILILLYRVLIVCLIVCQLL